MKIKGAIFDVDGTLLDSMYIWDSIGEEYLRSMHIEPKEGLKERLNNMSLYEAAVYYKSEYGITLPEQEIMDGVNKMIEDKYRYEAVCKEGTEDFLRKLKEKNVRMCIATATDTYLIEMALKRNNIDGYFDEIFTCTSVGCGKTKPLIYERALEFLNTDKAETVVFEDSLYAARTAKEAGFVVAAVYDRFEKSREELKELSDYYFNDFKEAESLFKQ